MTTTLKEALSKLDPLDPSHWTMDGSPRVDVIHSLTGNESYTRADITNAAPDLTRETVSADTPPETGETEASEEVEVPTLGGEVIEAATEVLEIGEGITSLEQLQGKLADATERMLDAHHDHEEAKQRSTVAANEVNAINRQIEVLQKSDPNHAQAGIRAYLNQQAQNRADRQGALEKFKEITGVGPKDAVKLTDPKSPLDKALAGRKPARGSTRPSKFGR